MIHKRPYVEEDSQEVACKNQRLESTNHLSQVVNGFIPYDCHKNSLISGEDGDSFSKCNENGVDASSCIPHFLWVNRNIMEADADLETPLNLSLFPEYFAPGHGLRALLQCDEPYSSLIDYSHRRLVPIGSEYQADVPEWNQWVLKSTSNHLDTLDSQVETALSSESDLIGTCVIPMPDREAPQNYSCEGWRNKFDCQCLDQGSVRCTAQHVEEAREKLKENLGLDIFEQLGFYDMGEEVAKKWTQEEEQEFHEVVLANPMSLGKNFWDDLPRFFLSRTKEDLVSYYFNVYVLRKRAKQNRFDPVNIDSDDDEWQKPEHESAVEDDDSVVESPPDQVVSAYHNDNHIEDCHEGIQDEDEMDSCEDLSGAVCRDRTDGEDEGDIDEISEPHIEHLTSGNESGFLVLGKMQKTHADDYDIQDDSCTSFEYQREIVDCGDPSETGMDVNQPSED
ncbi:hypothetical protein SLEP1_g20377 [Rubroshorea leprosula]|uniref:AT-rich interactive domain-containing protein 2 n=2 Tax=Rubroshorea leprosula TaxID=152421 RepID=A0AAV5J7X3_9ROSI|nr:hypothetical protein SLEP1_g20377 [Rubroshorea leprosula]